jgi:RES domain-containing protein
MKPIKEVREELRAIQTIRIKKNYYRLLGISYLSNLLSNLGSFKSGGRYNLQRAFGVLYLAPDPTTALEETVGRGFLPLKFPPKVLITIDVDIQTVLDLGNKKTIKQLGIDPKRLIQPWRIPRDKESYTQTLGRLIYESRRFEGLLYPSAKVSDKFNIGIFTERLQKGSKILVYDPDKLYSEELKG